MIAGGGYDLGLLLDGDADRAGAADERGTFVHQLQVTGLLMYYLAEHRGWRDPVVVRINNTSMAARLGERYGIETPRDPGRLQVHRAEDDRDRRDDGRRGVGRVRVRDAPARSATASTPTCCCWTCSCARRRPGAGRCRRPSRTSTRSPGRRSTGASTSTWTAPIYAGDEATPAGRPGRGRTRRRWPGAPVARTVTLDTGDGFKFFLDDGSWLLIRTSGTEPLVRVYTEATSAELRDALLDRRRAPGPRHMTRRRGRDRPSGRQAVGPRADLGPHRPLRRQDPRHRDRQAAVAPAPRGQGRVDPRRDRPTPAVPGGRRRRDPDRGARARAPPATSRPGGSTATRRSSAASSSRSPRRSSTTSSGSRTTSAARGRTRPDHEGRIRG